MLGIPSLVFEGLLIFSMVDLCVERYDVCPAERETNMQDIFGYVQKTIWKRIPCPTYRPGERLDGVIWYKGPSVDDPSTVRLISRDLRGGNATDPHSNERYSMSSNHTLVIEGFDERDEGNFLCQVIPHTTDVRVGSEDVQGTSIQDVFGASGYLQKTISHRIICPTFRPDESLDGVIWYKGFSVDDPSTVRLISRDLREGTNEDTHADERYSMSSNHSLVIEGVGDRDKGSFLCLVNPKTTDIRVGKVDVQVIGDTFPRGSSHVTSIVPFQRGHRQAIPCKCAAQIPDTPISVVYWSTGDGATTDTHIIGVHFSDGATLQVQHGADYSIGCDGSLTVNSLNAVQDRQRFWCHVFQIDATLRNCDSIVLMLDRQKNNDAFRASLPSFYLLEGEEQILPCFSWIPGSPTCEVQWLKFNSSGQHLLLSSNDHDANSEFDLASDFGLIIKSVDGEDAGRYRCNTGRRSTRDEVDVRVIGQRFVLDFGGVYASSEINFEAEKHYTFPCQAASNLAKIGSPATVFWSFAKPGNATTTVIGRLNIPGGSKTMSDLGNNDCFSISTEGALLLNRCFVEDDVRYWCHVFPENELLMKSYVDVIKPVPQDSFRTFAIVVSCAWALETVVGGVLLYKCYRKRDYSPVKKEDAVKYVNCRKNTIEPLREAADQLRDVGEKAQATQVVGGTAAAGAAGGAIRVAGTIVEIPQILAEDSEA